MARKVDPCLFKYKTVICILYVYDCLFWALSKSGIENIMKSFKTDRHSYNYKLSKEYLAYEYLDTDIRKLYGGGFQFYETVLVCKVLEATGMEHCNWLTITTNVEASNGINKNGSEANIYWTNSYDSVLGMVFIFNQTQRPDIYFVFHQCP